MKKRLILILNGKGGVGKSFFAVHFVQYLKDHQIAHAAFDSDDENRRALWIPGQRHDLCRAVERNGDAVCRTVVAHPTIKIVNAYANAQAAHFAGSLIENEDFGLAVAAGSIIIENDRERSQAFLRVVVCAAGTQVTINEVSAR